MSDTTPLETTSTPETPRRRGVLRPILIGVGSGVAILALGIGGFAIADELNDRDDDRLVITSQATDVPLPSETTILTPQPTDGVWLGPDDDAPISQGEYDAVSAAALAAVGGGTVTDLKRDDDPGKAWDVEVQLANGTEAEVELAADLSVIRIDLDS